MAVIDVFSRQGCHLCEIVLEQLLELTRGRASVVVHDVDSCSEWQSKYGPYVPVVECQGVRLCEYALDSEAVLAALAVEA